MAASNAFMHHGPITITPTLPSGSAVTLPRVTGVKRPKGGEIVEMYADGHAYPDLIKRVKEKRGVSIQSHATNKLDGLAPGTIYTVSWVEYDAKNGTGSGARTWTLTNCTLKNADSDLKENQFADGSVEFVAAGDTGDTDPLTVVEAA